MNVTVFVSGPSLPNMSSWVANQLGTGLVGMFGIVAAIPGAGAMFGVWRVASRDVLQGTKGEQVDLLLPCAGFCSDCWPPPGRWSPWWPSPPGPGGF